MAMKTKILTLCALLALAVAPAAAQGIYEANVATENSIVRVWQEWDVVIYNKEPSGQGGFLLYSVGSSTALRIDMPDSITVKDFEIMGENVWFCGVADDDSANPKVHAGVVGTFNIPDAFSGAAGINYAELNGWIGNIGYDIFVRRLERLDLFQMGNYTIMAMTGDSYIYQSEYMTRSTLVSAMFYPNSLNWEICALLDVDSTAIFTDIAALDNYVTAVGTDVDSIGLIAKSFLKGFNFPNSPTVPYYGDNIVCFSPIGKALITHLTGDSAAVVQLDKEAFTMLHMLDFATGSAVPVMPSRLTDDPAEIYDPDWDLKEIRYSQTTDNISVLEYGILPAGGGFETLLWTFPRTYWWPLAPVYTMSTVTQESMDVDIDNHPVTVGEVTGTWMLDVQSYTPGPIIIEEPLMEPDACIDYHEIDYTDRNPTVRPVLINDYGPIRRFPNQVHEPEVIEIDFTKICK